MRISIDIPDNEVQRVLAPLFARTLAPDTGAAPERMPAMLRIGDAARQLALSRNSLYQLVARGEIPSVKIGRSIRIPAESLATFIRDEAHRQKQEKEEASERWREWARRPRVARPPVPASVRALSSVQAQPKPSKKQIDLSPKPRLTEPSGWTREDQLGVLKSMEEGGWPRAGLERAHSIRGRFQGRQGV
jgi:excisionase family DNA binding protein